MKMLIPISVFALMKIAKVFEAQQRNLIIKTAKLTTKQSEENIPKFIPYLCLKNVTICDILKSHNNAL